VPCSDAVALATEVLSRDDCVEETPGGINDCEAQGYVCESELESGEAGSAFDARCRDGYAEVTFQQGAAEFADESYRLSFDAEGNPTAIGPFDIAGGDATTGEIIKDFGPPDLVSPEADVCTLQWQDLGLKALMVNFGSGGGECEGDGGFAQIIVIRSPLFETDEGLSVGDSESELLNLYPEATTRSIGGPANFDGSIPQSGDLYTVISAPYPIGEGGLVASLSALVESDEVTGLQVAPLLAGD
jgi:hypothetical protein